MTFPHNFFRIGQNLEDTNILGLNGNLKVLDEVIEMSVNFQNLGTFSEAKMLVVSNRVAIRLLKDGVLKKEHFDLAKELVDDRFRECIDLPLVNFSLFSFPVRILPEGKVGSNYIAFIDSSGSEII